MTAKRSRSKASRHRMDRSLLVPLIGAAVLAPLIIVLAPFIDAMGLVERIVLQVTMAAALLTVGFAFGTKVDE